MKKFCAVLFLAAFISSCESTEIIETNKGVELVNRPAISPVEIEDPIGGNQSGAVFLQTTSLENVSSDSNEVFCGGGGAPLNGTPNYFGANNINFVKKAKFNPYFGDEGINFSEELKRIINKIYYPHYMYPAAPGQHYVVDGYYNFTYFENNIPHVLTPSQSNGLRDKILLAIQQQFGAAENLYINQTYVATDYLLCATEWGLVTVRFQYGHHEID